MEVAVESEKYGGSEVVGVDILGQAVIFGKRYDKVY